MSQNVLEILKERFSTANDSTGSWLELARNQSFASFLAAGFPTVRDEEWKYTDLAPVAQGKLKIRKEEKEVKVPNAPLFSAEQCYELLLVNGLFVAERSSLPGNLVCTDLKSAIKTHPQLIEAHINRFRGFKEHALTELNTAFMNQGLFLFIPKGALLDKPVHIRHLIDQAPDEMFSPRSLIVIEEAGEGSIIESFSGDSSQNYFVNALTEINLASRARCTYHKIQAEGPYSHHVGAVKVYQAKESTFFSLVYSSGGALSRTDVYVELDGERAESFLYGISVGSEKKIIDNHTAISHAKPNCHSFERYKSILGGSAKGVFNGKILVKPDAQKTDAKQSNNALLLSKTAEMNSKPELQIFADDVKCTHGATVGELDEDALFYIRARGVPQREAMHMLTLAFAREVLDLSPLPYVKQYLEQELESAIVGLEQG